MEKSIQEDILIVNGKPDPASETFEGLLICPLPAASLAKVPPPPAFDISSASNQGRLEEEQSLVRPGYRAIRYPMPQTAQGEDRVMPAALAGYCLVSVWPVSTLFPRLMSSAG